MIKQKTTIPQLVSFWLQPSKPPPPVIHVNVQTLTKGMVFVSELYTPLYQCPFGACEGPEAENPSSFFEN